MRYVITGATGPVGLALVRSLVDDGHDVTVLSRRPARAYRLLPAVVSVVLWSGRPGDDIRPALGGADTVINLAGASIGRGRWTSRRKREILESRTQATQALVEAIGGLPADERPAALINASGTDFYGDQPTGISTESSRAGDSFLAHVSAKWEDVARTAERLGVRVVFVRAALVVAADAPAFKLMCLPIRLGVGGQIGSGAQPFSWIHIDDLVGIFRLAATDTTISGPINAVAEPATESDAVHVLGDILHRPTRVRLPGRIVRALMGEQADLLLHGRTTAPRVALTHGYRFLFPTMREAFSDVLGPPRRRHGSPSDSPFERGISLGRSTIVAPELRDQFLGVPEDQLETYLVGTMDRIWHRPAVLWPLFWMLARFDTLFPETGHDVPATMTVRNFRTHDGRPWQTWQRTFELGRVRRRFNTRMTFDPVRGQTVERTGPGGCLEVPWRIVLGDQGLEIEALSVSLRIGRLRLPIPDALSVRVRAVETTDVARPGHIHINLTLANRLVGPIFGYEGTFRVERRPQLA